MDRLWSFFGLIFLAAVSIETGYLYLLTLASCLPIRLKPAPPDSVRFAVAITASNEEAVIADTIRTIQTADYPSEYLKIYVVADHCSDATAQHAREAGATVFERVAGERKGKGASLSWLFQRIFEQTDDIQAVAIFDADTSVDAHFFTVMSHQLAQGDIAIQGKHIIRNHRDGWLPSLIWAMFIIDNRFQNQGRANLGLSAKNMGDSICFRAEVLQRYGWGSGLTEDYALRQRLLVDGICIAYTPDAIGYGDAVLDWRLAHSQRSRWLRGVQRANRGITGRLLRQGLIRRSLPLLEGALQVIMPSYSTLTLLAVILTALSWLISTSLFSWLPWAFTGVTLALFFFPFLNLALEKAPVKAFLVILTGPVYILWRSWLKLYATLTEKDDTWIKTPHTRRNN
jgi:cellulose synthase/poly-beta-1,6-N-acetylglucosamine synthase-like glycosyltransferase